MCYPGKNPVQFTLSFSNANNLITINSCFVNLVLNKTAFSYFTVFMSTPLAGGHIIFAFSVARRLPSRHLVSAHLKEKYFSYHYQIWYGCLLG